MIHSRAFFISIVVALFCANSWAQNAEIQRLSGFAQHQKNLDQFDVARSKGERAHLEEEEQWENQKLRALEDYKSRKSSVRMSEDGPEAQADAAAKRKVAQEYEESREKYAAQKSKLTAIDRQALHLPTEATELGLDELRPRYDYRKRAMFGAQSKFGRPGSSSSSGGSSGFGGGGGSSFPPPPTFDDFGGGDGGYVPAPNMSDDFGDVPPPPPPPPPGFGDDFGGFQGGADFPPPPPPPPPFGDEGGEF
ncbi:hypothetical protein AZI87_11110 [Bdellovibrio bacteriovorus]|uniref:Uncharacterized protein n=1 Tax=Bdellovibrio bacteriovorus TaxID=959 RepID=A0A162G6L6_BDEBC|nr:hypothetical protein [Bdellovibrio bacteriovorus]KYG65113.1 hypothetical protein AZI87_11110 [Bdellovibrio bacteriovorus]